MNLKSIIIIVVLAFSSFVNGQNITLMTYNVRYGLAHDGENSWGIP